MVMKLNKCLNGLVKYPLYWYNNLKGAFEEKGFKPILLDTCMFHGRGMNALIYVDDELLFVLDQDKIGEFIKELENYSLLLTVEEDMYYFLGVGVRTNNKSGKVTLTQGYLTILIKRPLQHQQYHWEQKLMDLHLMKHGNILML